MRTKQLFLAAGMVVLMGAPLAFAGATISGVVKFDGKAPTFKEIKMDADPVCLSHHKEPVFPQTLLLGDGNTMGNVFVYVKNAPQGDYPVPADVAVIDPKWCIYSPHVIGVRAGLEVKILNPDGTLNNVHAISKVNPEFNLAMPKFRTEVEKVWDKSEFMFTLKCDVHPWMTAHISTMAHPFFMVTGTDGKFEIKDLPDGTYEVEAWHEKLGAKTATVVVKDGAAQATDFTFSAPTKG